MEFIPPSMVFGKAVHEAVAFFYRTLKQQGERPTSVRLDLK
jgi:hypothetical protein